MHTIEDGSGLRRITKCIIDPKRSVRFPVKLNETRTRDGIERSVRLNSPTPDIYFERVTNASRSAAKNRLHIRVNINPGLDHGVPITHVRILADIADEVPR
jgi:hypothetical protein